MGVPPLVHQVQQWASNCSGLALTAQSHPDPNPPSTIAPARRHATLFLYRHVHTYFLLRRPATLRQLFPKQPSLGVKEDATSRISFENEGDQLEQHQNEQHQHKIDNSSFLSGGAASSRGGGDGGPSPGWAEDAGDHAGFLKVPPEKTAHLRGGGSGGHGGEGEENSR